MTVFGGSGSAFPPQNSDTPVTRYVGCPHQHSICEQLSKDITIVYNTSIKYVLKESSTGFKLITDTDEIIPESFNAIIVAAPAPQTSEIIKDISPKLVQKINTVKVSATWAVLLGIKPTISIPFDAAFVHNSPISWVAKNNSKPLRFVKNSDIQLWVIHGSSEWSDKNIELTPEQAQQELLKAFSQITLVSIERLINESFFKMAYKWHYATPKALVDPYLMEVDENGLIVGVCGDWCGGPRVEGAFMSGYNLAQTLLGQK